MVCRETSGEDPTTRAASTLRLSIPKVLRGLFERERSLLSLLSQTSYQSILKSFQEIFHRKDVRPGSVTSIQTFGSFAANFNPHCHCLVTEGAFTPPGEFLPLPTPATYILADIEVRFRKFLLKRLHRAERLSETFMNQLLEWIPSGFSVHAEQLVFDDETQKLENLALYLTRAPITLSSITQTPEGQVGVTTPPHPLTGNNALSWMLSTGFMRFVNRSRTVANIFLATTEPTPTEPATLYHKTTCLRPGVPVQCRTSTNPPTPHLAALPGHDSSEKSSKWTPCSVRKCGAEMKILAVLTHPKVVDRIIRHLVQNPTDEPKAPRPPPPPSKPLDDTSPAHVNL